ncbi:hypothetical protein DFA_07645 [Cavenderia fasciculata]|uniref:MACPF domain-containing protein n=1 Tax=Cavenderia fasciculata TaxID=261658 RepID=F4Q2I8_CACFS|nr:uncharacterized protein DFA_07645 [Cavenderia fasciculata]EGG16667.1 hypothetical protein DFA_07645 [Cavenderia fasciculata]|eukprot:XP_004355141.1 hypothetical protein DFA_07645 [Cavenderia fasciculata]
MISQMDKRAANILYLHPGQYLGENDIVIEGLNLVIEPYDPYAMNNHDHQMLNMPLFSRANISEHKITIDCRGFGRGISIVNSQVELRSVTLLNCSASYGSAIFIVNSNVILEDVDINSCRSHYGSIFVNDSSLVSNKCSFVDNKVANHGEGLVFLNSKATIENIKLSNSTHRHVIATTSSTIQINGNISRSMIMCDKLSTVENKDRVDLCDDTKQHCGDGHCSPHLEDHFSCPLDCRSTIFSGFLMESKRCPTCPTTLSPHYSSSINSNKQYLNIKLSSYFINPFDGKISFLFELTNIDIIVQINNNQIINYINSGPHLQKIKHTIYLPKTKTNHLKIIIISQNNLKKSLSIKYSPHHNNNTFIPFTIARYSKNICGDGVKDNNETCDPFGIKSHEFPDIFCGNGICDEKNYNQCFQDCNEYLYQRCPPLTVRPGGLPPSIRKTSDTIGMLIFNQHTWRLPGYQHLSFGVDIVTGELVSHPIFHFGFCSDMETNIIEDPYRNIFYESPREMSVVPRPQCKYHGSNEVFSSSTEMKTDKQKKSKLDTSANAGANIAGIVQVSIEAAFSKESSVKKARSLEQKSKGTIIESSIVCQTSAIKLNKFPFNPTFINDLKSADNEADFYRLVKKFGTHFMKKVVLGGKLSVVQSINEKLTKSQVESNYQEQIDMSVKASVTSEVVSASASYSSSNGKQEENKDESESSNKFQKTSLTSRGGKLGSYGNDGEPTYFGTWASSVDLNPVPIEYELSPIESLIHLDWMTKSNRSVKEMWKNAYNTYMLYASKESDYQEAVPDFAIKEKWIWFISKSLPNHSFNHFSIQIKENNKITSSLDARLFPSVDIYNKADLYQLPNLLDYLVFSSDFKTSFVSQLENKQRSTTIYSRDAINSNLIPTKEMDDKQQEGFGVENIIFRETGEKVLFPKWMIGLYPNCTTTNLGEFPIYSIHTLDQGEIINHPPENYFKSYLLIPPILPIKNSDHHSYFESIRVKVWTKKYDGEKKGFFDTRNSSSRHWRIIQLSDTQTSMVMAARQIRLEFNDKKFNETLMDQLYFLVNNGKNKFLPIKLIYGFDKDTEPGIQMVIRDPLTQFFSNTPIKSNLNPSNQALVKFDVDTEDESKILPNLPAPYWIPKDFLQNTLSQSDFNRLKKFIDNMKSD